MSDRDKIRGRYARVYRSLAVRDLRRGSAETAGAGGLGDPLDLIKGNDRLWLDFYSAEGLWLALTRYGLVDELAARGYPDVELSIYTDDPDEHLLRIVSREAPREPLIELVACRAHLELWRPRGVPRPRVTALSVEWLLMQSVEAKFCGEKPPLPGQRHPGLGVGRAVFELLRRVRARLKLDAILTVPSYFHNAWMYADDCRFLDPYDQGEFEAMRRDLARALRAPSSPLSEAALPGALSWAMQWGLVRRLSPEGEAIAEWRPRTMVGASIEAVGGSDYFDATGRARERVRYEIDAGELAWALKERGVLPLDRERVRSLLEQT